MNANFGTFAGGERYLQGLYDLLCLFGKLTQEECLHMSVHNSTVNALKVHLPCHVLEKQIFRWLDYLIFTYFCTFFISVRIQRHGSVNR